MQHRYKSNSKGGRKAKRGGVKRIRVGSRNPGATGQGSIRRPY